MCLMCWAMPLAYANIDSMVTVGGQQTMRKRCGWKRHEDTMRERCEWTRHEDTMIMREEGECSLVSSPQGSIAEYQATNTA